MKRLLLLIFCLCLCPQTYASPWHNLFKTPDQQAAEALQQGNPRRAASLFENQQWRGIANYRAGNYEAAATEFSRSHSAEDFYNRGNALAHLSQYDQAIAAYHQALQRNPRLKDAQYNLHVVEALKKQQQKQSKQNQSQHQKQQQQQSAKQSKPSARQTAPQQQASHQSKPPRPSLTNKQQRKASKQGSDKQKVENRQARNQSKQTDPQIDQWLRRVPDDPGGLLREKFLRDHLRYRDEEKQGKILW